MTKLRGSRLKWNRFFTVSDFHGGRYVLETVFMDVADWLVESHEVGFHTLNQEPVIALIGRP